MLVRCVSLEVTFAVVEVPITPPPNSVTVMPAISVTTASMNVTRLRPAMETVCVTSTEAARVTRGGSVTTASTTVTSILTVMDTVLVLIRESVSVVHVTMELIAH